MNPLLFRAWTAAKRGDYAQAGQLYRSAGRLEAAAEMFLKAGELRAAAAVEEELGRIFDAAKHLAASGEKESAAALLRRHCRHLQAAHLYAELGQYAQASALASEAGKPLLAAEFLEQEGKHYEAGELLRHHAEHLSRAMLAFERALASFPDTASMDAESASHWNQRKEVMAEVFERGGDSARAAELYEDLGMESRAAICHEKAGRLQRALELFRAAGAQEKVAELLERLQDTPVELKAETAAALGQKEASAAIYLEAGTPEKAAPLLEEAGRLEEAADAWREAGEWERAGNAYYRCGRFSEAAECFRLAQLYSLALSAYEEAGALSEASRMAFEAGMWERAYELARANEDRTALLKQLQAVPEGRPEWSRARLLCARAFVDLDQPDLALECIRDLPDDAGDGSPWLDYVRARALEALGRREEAVGAYRKVLARELDFQDARLRLKAAESGARGGPASRGDRYRREDAFDSEERGTWWRGRDCSLDTPVLLFEPSGEALEGAGGRIPQGALTPFLDLRDASVLGVRDGVEGPGGPLVVHEPFEGEALPEAWGAAGGFRPFECIGHFRQVLTALREAHARGLRHGHLEASSVLVGPGGEVKVRGFGLGWAGGASWRGYASPEALSGRNPGPTDDLYAAGMILLAELLGSFPPPDPQREPLAEILESRVPPDFPSRARALLGRLVSREPHRRFGSADEVLAELDAMELLPGAVVADRYEILQELGRGGMGQVFKVRDLELDEVAALKTLRGKVGMSEQGRARFLREIKLTRKITHPNVIRVFDLGQFRDITFLTMEFIPGQTLSQWVRQGSGRVASLGEKVRVLTGIASGLAEAHRLGIVHRDLKPQNVILTPDGVPKLLDFGIAYAGEGADLTQEGHFVGSPKYVSPEQIQGKVPDVRSDVYCFGLLAYFLLTGDDAFPGDNPAFILMRQMKEVPVPPSKVIRVPPSLERLVMRCLQKAPEARPSGIPEVLDLLRSMA